VLCASFAVQSSTGKYSVQALQYKVVLGSALCKLCSTKNFVKAFLCKCICVSSVSVQKFLRPIVFLCKRLLSDSKSFLACRTAEMSWDELRGDTLISARMRWKQLRRTYLDDMWEEMRWDEKSWDEVRWGEKSWDEVRWGEKSSHDLRWDDVWSVKCKCEVWRVQCEVWGKFLLGVALRRGCAQVMFLDNICATASHKACTHGPGWRTEYANSIHEKGLIVYP